MKWAEVSPTRILAGGGVMRALVVFESMFGNTRTVAEAVAEGLTAHLPVEVVEVSYAPVELGADVALLVVGAPTHAFGMSRPQTRLEAAQQAGDKLVSKGIGVREWLEAVRPLRGVEAATFDTHVDKKWIPGSAARAAHKRLRALGFATPVAAESFYVTGTPGPLADGEQERARHWGETLATRLPVQH
jgi:hypothetical protein